MDMTLTNTGSTLDMGSGTTPAINPVSEEGAVAVATVQTAGSPDAVTGSSSVDPNMAAIVDMPTQLDPAEPVMAVGAVEKPNEDMLPADSTSK